MTLYTNFIGIDIGKNTFVANAHGHKEVKEYEYDSKGIKAFIKDYKAILPTSLCILEVTGGYELELLLTLCDEGFSAHRAHGNKVKYFIKSYGNAAKTDRLDAKALARYGHERHVSLEKFSTPSKDALKLYELVQRRLDLKKMLVAEKNRLQSPRASAIKPSCLAIIEAVEKQVDLITDEIKKLIMKDKVLVRKIEVLKTVNGIGDIISFELLSLLPELGSIDRRKIASLAGLAPNANDSGQYQGYRHTKPGRSDIKPILYMAAMAAAHSKSALGDFYRKLVASGKKKLVAMVALMRKILVIANARLRDYIQEQQETMLSAEPKVA